MTEQELKDIVAAVVAELEKSGVDFDYKAEQAKDDDLVFVIRGTAPNYQGMTVTWKGLLDIITAQATQAKNDAETAKNAANAILSQVTTMKNNVTTMESNVSTMKASVETTKSQVEGMKNAVETTKGQVETMKISVETSKSQVETMKTSIETTKGEVETLKEESETAKETATQKAAETTQAKSDVELMKASVEQTVTDFNALADQKKSEVQGVYQSDLNELKGDLDTERNARIEADTDHSTRLQKVELASSVNRYEIENLKAKSEGKLYRTETVEAEAYTVDVPSSVAPYAEVQRIGGKSVVWNQVFKNNIKGSFGITYTNNSDGSITLNGTSKDLSLNFGEINKYQNVVGKFFIIFEVINNPNNISLKYGWLNRSLYVDYNITSGKIYAIFNQTSDLLERNKYQGLIGFSYGTVFEDVKVRICNINLTRMFGEGNEPTLKECQKIFSEDYYPYDEGTIKSFPVKRVRSVNAEGTEIGSMDISSFTSDFKSAGSVHDEWENGKKIKKVGERAYTSGDESESNYITDGTTTYYPLDIPTEETVPEIDNYINVEGGGSLTFESDETIHMPVPDRTRFVVDLTSTTEETT